jgi:hypothetical protein
MQDSERRFHWNVAPLLSGGADYGITDKCEQMALDLSAPASDPKCSTTLSLLKSALAYPCSQPKQAVSTTVTNETERLTPKFEAVRGAREEASQLRVIMRPRDKASTDQATTDNSLMFA